MHAQHFSAVRHDLFEDVPAADGIHFVFLGGVEGDEQGVSRIVQQP